MATHTVPATSDTGILSQLTWPDDDALSPAAAKGWLAVRFDQSQLERMHELAMKNQEGKLTAKEKHELENYCRVGIPLDLMHSKAHRSVKKHQKVQRRHGCSPHPTYSPARWRTLRILPSAAERSPHAVQINCDAAIAVRESLIAEGRF
jgi:uncharacterized protein YnzC (UPF0291/DUF896 family)